MKSIGFDTLAIHGDDSHKDAHRAIRFPIYSGVAFDFETAEDIAQAFAWRKPAHIYSRITNPTVEVLERKMTLLEEGTAAVALSSGMAAISNVFLTLLRQGDNLVASRFLFGNTYSFLKTTLSSYGIEARFVDTGKPEEVEKAIDGDTRILFTETIANPMMVAPDLRKLGEIAKSRGLVFVVDGTVTTPYLFKAGDFSVDVSVHSTTKFISGGASSVGGVIVDMGNYDWANHKSLSNFKRFGKGAFIARLRKEVYRNLGTCMSPQTAWLQNLGLETLTLRVEKTCANALRIAEFLETCKKVLKVNYPGLNSSKYYKLAQKQFPKGSGGILSFELKDKENAFSFLNKLRLIRIATNLSDNFSLALHPASTIFSDFSLSERAKLGVSEGLVRLSAGIENIEDLINDLSQALN